MSDEPVNDWYWASPHIGPVGDKFIIENGQDALWRRVRVEIDRDENCSWMPIHRLNKGAQLEDILDLLLTVGLTMGVNVNRFMFEAAKIPVFAKFLRNARSDICNYVSNPSFLADDMTLIKYEPYSDAARRKLAQIVSETLGCGSDWYE